MFGRRDYREVLIETLQKQNLDLMDRLTEMIGSVHHYQVDMHKPQYTASPGPTVSGVDALWKSEEEEEVEEMYRDGYIDARAMTEALAEIGAMNTEVFQN